MKKEGEVDSMRMANYLMLLSGRTNLNSCKNNRVFECKTCNRKFASFQALGGHRASHKKTKLMGEMKVIETKTHQCSICGLEFAIGQALGGHMRRHKAAASNMMSLSPNHATKTKTILFPDLNLTPLENHLEFLKIPQPTPLVHCFN